MNRTLADVQRDLDRLRDQIEIIARDLGIVAEDLRGLAEKEGE